MLVTVAAALVFANALDGDTLVVRNGDVKTLLRLAQVDAPEKSMPYSEVSRRNLVLLCKDAVIDFEPVTIDRYHRTVARVVCNGVIVNRSHLARLSRLLPRE